MIQLSDYWMGRDQQYGLRLSTALRADAARTVELANKLLILAKGAGVTLEPSPRTGNIVTSGWRPAEVNESTPGAAVRSRHITCQAIDLYDPDGDLDDWLLNSPQVLMDLGLWLEHPSATKGWAHVQTVPPRSLRRVFYP